MRTLILPSAEPAGTVATCTPGVAEFGATLLWDSSEDASQGPLLPALPESVRCSVVETGDPTGARREILGQILALTERELGAALEAVIRSLTSGSALSGALLETRVVRVAWPAVTPAHTIQAVAFDLWKAGFGVSFGPSWTPAPAGGVAVGFRGAEKELGRFFGAHPSWEIR
ncbi:MAG: hypothetical protein ACRDTR_15620 [Rubrobacter sp.]